MSPSLRRSSQKGSKRKWEVILSKTRQGTDLKGEEDDSLVFLHGFSLSWNCISWNLFCIPKKNVHKIWKLAV